VSAKLGDSVVHRRKWIANCSLIGLLLLDPFDRETNQLITIAETQFAFDVCTIRFDGLYAQVKFASDVLGSKPASEQLNYFKLSTGEPVQRRVDIATSRMDGLKNQTLAEPWV
jgi:hypothetical protein